MKAVDRSGTFKATATEWSVRTIATGAPIITVFFECFAVLEGDEWESIEPRTVKGDFFVLKKTGAPNEKVAEMLCLYVGWGGSFAEVVGSPPSGDIPMQIDVEGRDYKNKTYYQASWIRAVDAPPRGGGSITHDEASDLDAKFGKSLGSIAKKVATTKPAQRPDADYGCEIPF